MDGRRITLGVLLVAHVARAQQIGPVGSNPYPTPPLRQQLQRPSPLILPNSYGTPPVLWTPPAFDTFQARPNIVVPPPTSAPSAITGSAAPIGSAPPTAAPPPYRTPNTPEEAEAQINNGHFDEFLKDFSKAILPASAVGLNVLGSALVVMPHIQRWNAKLPGGGLHPPPEFLAKATALRELAAKSGNKLIVKLVSMPGPKVGEILWIAAMIPRAMLAINIGLQNNQAGMIVSNIGQLLLAPIAWKLGGKQASSLVEIAGAAMFVIAQAHLFDKEAGLPTREYPMNNIKSAFSVHSHMPISERLSTVGHESVALLKQTAGDHKAAALRVKDALTQTHPIEPGHEPTSDNPLLRKLQTAWLTHDGWKTILKVWGEGADKGDALRTELAAAVLYASTGAAAMGASGTPLSVATSIAGFFSDLGIARWGVQHYKDKEVGMGTLAVGAWGLESVGSGLTTGIPKTSKYSEFGPATRKIGQAMAQAYFPLRGDFSDKEKKHPTQKDPAAKAATTAATIPITAPNNIGPLVPNPMQNRERGNPFCAPAVAPIYRPQPTQASSG